MKAKDKNFDEGRSRRRLLIDSLQAVEKRKKEEMQQYSRQVDYDNAFDTWEKEAFAGTAMLLRPPYLPSKMYELYEQSAKLSACVNAYIDNIDGYGYDIISSISEDDDIQGEENPQSLELKNFFDYPNDVESLTTIREKLRRDLEVTGNAYLEVVRSRDGKPVMLFWMDAKRVRLSSTREPVIEGVELIRGGQKIVIPAEKRYRSYCMLSSDGNSTGPRARYFKQYGDKRNMSAETGRFEENPAVPATEVIHFKIGNDIYGVPRWIGAILSVMGSWKSNYVNYDLFDNQGIPPMVVTIAGGSLTEESFQDLVDLFQRAKGVQNFHKLLILEAESVSSSIDGKENIPKIEVKDLTEYRSSDAMFLQYLDYCNNDIQKNGFRLPGMLVGISDDANYATAFIVRKSAEEQLFIPERRRFDEVINKTIVKDFGIRNLAFKSNGPALQNIENIQQVLNMLINAGVFTVNGLISFVNTHLGTNIAFYDEEWANQPMGNYREVVSLPLDEETDSEVEEAIEKSQNIQVALEALSQAVKGHVSGCACS